MNFLQFIPALNEASAKTIEVLAREIWPEHYASIIGKTQVDYMLKTRQSQKAVLDQVDRGTLYFLIHPPEGFPVGYLALEPRQDELFLSKLYLRLSQRGKGYGSQALDFSRCLALAKGLPKITLTVHKRNPSVKTYQNWGFTIMGPVVTDIGEGFVMDDYRMELPL
jgi:GNAT superfamily N-acetyltransferase